jgi:sulfur carrier protein ThiS
MTQILLISNPFNPLHEIERFHVGEGITPREWLAEHFGPDFIEFDRPTVLQWNGELVMRADWETRRFEDGDVAAFVHVPQGIEVLIVALIVAVVVGVAAYLLMPDPKIPSDQTQSPDSVYTLRGQTNRFRPNEPIEVVYGKVRHWPTYACRPYSEYIGNQQYQYSLFCLGQGRFDIEAIQLDDTPVEDFTEVQIEIVQPGGTVDLVEANVVTAVEVSNIELLGPNEEDYTGISGPYTLNDFDTPIKRIAVDVSFPQGLYKLNDEGDLTSQSVELLFEYREIGEGGGAIGGWETLENPTVTRRDNTPQRITYSKAVPSGRYEVRGRRVSDKPGSTRVASQVRWETAKGYAKIPASFGSVTMIAMKALATNSLNDSSSKRFNVIATRKLPQWNAVDGWVTAVDSGPTRNPIWAFCDIFRASYGAKLTTEFLDMPTLKALADVYEARGDCFDWVFDGPLSVWEAAKMALRVGRALPIPQGSLISAVRDVPQTLPAAVFNQHNIVKGSLKKVLNMFDFQPFDGVIVEYTDPDTWQQKEVTCVLPGRDGLNLDRVKFPGCTKRNKAFQEGMYIQSRRELQRKTVTFQTGLEGHIPAYMDLISITHDTLRVGQGGMILDYNTSTNEMTLSEQVNFATTAVVHKLAIRGDDGAIMGTPITVTPGSAPNKVILASDPPEALDFSPDRVPPLYAFGVADVWAFMGKVSGIRPLDENTVEITAVNYVPAVYGWEDSTTVDAIEVKVIRNRSNPVVQWVTIAPVPEKAERAYIDWLPVGGAASYVVQTSYDDGDTWNPAGNFTSPPVEIGTNPGTLIARVAPFALNGNVIYTESAPFIVGSNVTPPASPEAAATQPDFKALVATAKWSAVSGANGYVADIYTGGVFKRSIAVGTALRADYDFDQYTADGGTGREIEFRVKAFNAGGSGVPTSIARTNAPPVTAPAALAVGAPTGTDYPASWTYAPTEGDELEFRVYASTVAGFTPGPSNLVATRTTPDATISAPVRPLYWRVAIVDKWGPELTLSTEAVIP